MLRYKSMSKGGGLVWNHAKTWLGWIGLSFLLGACATDVPRPIRDSLPESPGLAQVRENPAAFQGRVVRWGGTLAGVQNQAQETILEVVDRPLERGGRPIESDRSAGRFLVRAKGFLDPSVYANNRQVTVYGQISGSEQRKIGEFPYTYPVVVADQLHLWPPYVEPQPYYRDPYWYDPWYPWGPWHPWGYPYPYRYRW